MKLKFKNIKDFKLFKPKTKFYSIDLKGQEEHDTNTYYEYKWDCSITEFNNNKIEQHTGDFTYWRELFFGSQIKNTLPFSINDFCDKKIKKNNIKTKKNNNPNIFVFIDDIDKLENFLSINKIDLGEVREWQLLKKGFSNPQIKNNVMFVNILDLAKELSKLKICPDLYETITNENWENYNILKNNKEQNELKKKGMRNIIIAQYILKLTQKENLYEVYEMVRNGYNKQKVHIVDYELKYDNQEKEIVFKTKINTKDKNPVLNNEEESTLYKRKIHIDGSKVFWATTDNWHFYSKIFDKDYLNEQTRYLDVSNNHLVIVGFNESINFDDYYKEIYKEYAEGWRFSWEGVGKTEWKKWTKNTINEYKQGVENIKQRDWKEYYYENKCVTLPELFMILKHEKPNMIQFEDLESFIETKKIKENKKTEKTLTECVVNELLKEYKIENVFELSEIVIKYLQKQSELKLQQKLKIQQERKLEEEKKQKLEQEKELKRQQNYDKEKNRLEKELQIKISQ